ncbi:MAG: hypothetical protein LUC90_04220 [Lachnospiraceae bacterium]|nr:hypothetical protein [Lachnospiraceae bacterium]
MIKNVIEKAENARINPMYELTISNLKELREGCKDPCDLIRCSFNFGYLQGMKAAKAEARAAGKKKPAAAR